MGDGKTERQPAKMAEAKNKAINRALVLSIVAKATSLTVFDHLLDLLSE